jgi:hypothetical protein
MAKGKGAASDMLVVGSKVREYIKSKGLMCSSEVLGAVNGCVYACLDRAAERAKENGRKTLQARDM